MGRKASIERYSYYNRTPWLDVTGWLEHFAGADIRRIARATQAPSERDDAEVAIYLRTIQSIFRDIFFKLNEVTSGGSESIGRLD